MWATLDLFKIKSIGENQYYTSQSIINAQS